MPNVLWLQHSRNFYFASIIVWWSMDGSPFRSSGDFHLEIQHSLWTWWSWSWWKGRKRGWRTVACSLKAWLQGGAHYSRLTSQWKWVVCPYLTAKRVGTGFPWLGSCFQVTSLYHETWEWTSRFSWKYLFRGRIGVGQVICRATEFRIGWQGEPVTHRNKVGDLSVDLVSAEVAFPLPWNCPLDYIKSPNN